MYNGIGLSTARGSGTNGYVQRNLSTLKPRTKFSDQRFDETKAPVIRKANQEILTHERKREIELKCFTLQQQLEAKGETEVAERVQNLREELLKKLEDQQLDSKRFKEHQVHQIAEAKEKADARIRAAFGIRDDFVPGAAFDKDLQARLKQERMEARERREEERKVRIAEMEESRRKEAEKRQVNKTNNARKDDRGSRRDVSISTDRREQRRSPDRVTRRPRPDSPSRNRSRSRSRGYRGTSKSAVARRSRSPDRRPSRRSHHSVSRSPSSERGRSYRTHRSRHDSDSEEGAYRTRRGSDEKERESGRRSRRRSPSYSDSGSESSSGDSRSSSSRSRSRDAGGSRRRHRSP